MPKRAQIHRAPARLSLSLPPSITSHTSLHSHPWQPRTSTRSSPSPTSARPTPPHLRSPPPRSPLAATRSSIPRPPRPAPPRPSRTSPSTRLPRAPSGAAAPPPPTRSARPFCCHPCRGSLASRPRRRRRRTWPRLRARRRTAIRLRASRPGRRRRLVRACLIMGASAGGRRGRLRGASVCSRRPWWA